MDDFKPEIQRCIKEIDAQGFAVIREFLSPALLAKVRETLGSMLGRYRGRNNFEGTSTERIYTLVARGRIFEDIAEDPRIMGICEHFLQPNFLLTASQVINVHPGESPQPFHTDDTFYPIPRPRPMIGLSTIVAVDDFTVDNGATEVIPGSHLWGDEEMRGEYRRGPGELDSELEENSKSRARSVEMPAGACIVFSGTLLHRGAANISDSARCAFSNQYCEPWARTQENFYLAIPPERVREMSPRLQSLLGYSIHPPFMGQVTASHPAKALEAGFVPPLLRELP
ncbi:MAG: phytanoyl-CoA dioxygenase family protein [Myxococcota bacterium]|nr:phytanoyl-CoA dioxygenase family protein [Myxococcota bacterium]